MIKEIQQISQEMLTLNSQIYGAILSEKDLIALEEVLIKIKLLQENINSILDQASLISMTDTKKSNAMVTKLYELLTELGIMVEKVYDFSDKFVCNYREEWNIIKTNQA